ncbi:MAG: helix-turn-helix domain-containing protein [Aestuariibaculum sp.]
MINIEAFTKRLQTIIDYYGESASSFAENIGVQRSSISHILSGRNKPSLDFILKILSTYPEVELYWLLNGKGNFPSTPVNTNKNPDVTNVNKSDKASKIENKTINPMDFNSTKDKSEIKTIERIVIFYTDGTFKNFKELK